MNTSIYSLLSALAGLATMTTTQAADFSGNWKAEFETQIGLQEYTYSIQQDGENMTGRAHSVINDETRETELKEVKITGDEITFFETFTFQGNEVRIDYKGTLSGDEVRFTREVGEFATENLVAKREPAEPPAASDQPRRGRGGFGGPIELGPDDKPAFPDPPVGFDVERDGIPHGQLAMIEYESRTVGTTRRMQVYTPPGYSADRKYPVLYLLHGIGGDETEWQRFARPEVILDNLLAEGEAVPMIVVMPNGRAQENDRAEGDIFKSAPAFANFERDLLDDVIPAIESRYSVQADRDHRALAGLSMGGGQSLNFGLGHLDTFAWVGAFSPAPNTRSPGDLVPDPAAATRQLKLLWLSCGSKDGLIRISRGVHDHLKANEVPHIWHVDGNAHDTPEWKNNLYLFSQRVFTDNPMEDQ